MKVFRFVYFQNPDSMVSTSNVDNLPELNLFPEPQGYYRTASPDIMLITHTDDPTNTTMQDYSQDITVDSQVLMEPVREPVGPAYYLQKKVKRPMSVRFNTKNIYNTIFDIIYSPFYSQI